MAARPHGPANRSFGWDIRKINHKYDAGHTAMGGKGLNRGAVRKVSYAPTGWMMNTTRIFYQVVGLLTAFLPFLIIGGIWAAIEIRRRAKPGRDKRHSAEDWAHYRPA